METAMYAGTAARRVGAHDAFWSGSSSLKLALVCRPATNRKAVAQQCYFFAAFFCAAQRFFCAAAIRALASGLRWRRLRGFA